MRLAVLLLILTALRPAAAFQLGHADLVILSADIRTMSAKKQRAEAVAITGGKIIAVGSNKEITAFIGPVTRKIDAAGRLVLPGFNDAHVHFAAVGNRFSSIDLRAAKTAADILAELARYVRFLPKGRWILGGGWNRTLLSDSAGLTRAAIDAVTPDNPVFIYSSDPDAAFTNGAALMKAGISRSRQGSAEKGIERTADGEPTGMLSGPAVRMVSAVVPPGHTRNWPEVIETASNYAASLGVTSVQDMHSDELADVYRELDRLGKLKTRVYDCAPISSRENLQRKGIKAASGSAMVRTGCVKYFSEGDAADAPQLGRDIAAADKAGLQVMIHAIGPRANAVVLDAFEFAIKANGKRDRRFRIEHAERPVESDLQRFARSSIIASMQPWLFRGSETDHKRRLQLGTRLAFGSDASMADLNPLYGIYTAASGPNPLSIEDAVRAYTIGSAYAEFQEKVKGTIEPGKLADIVVLSDNIFSVATERIRNTRVEYTIASGNVVYARPAHLSH